MPSRCPLSSSRYLPVLCLALSACTSSGRVHVTIPPTRLAVYRTVLVQVWSQVADAQKEAIQLEATVAMIAQEKIPFQHILTKRNSPESSVDLRVEARIVRLDRVTVESRALNGMVAGRARVVADVMLIEATSRVVARFTVEGESSSAGTTEQAIKRASEQVVAFMAAHFNG